MLTPAFLLVRLYLYNKIILSVSGIFCRNHSWILKLMSRNLDSQLLSHKLWRFSCFDCISTNRLKFELDRLKWRHQSQLWIVTKFDELFSQNVTSKYSKTALVLVNEEVNGLLTFYRKYVETKGNLLIRGKIIRDWYH